MNAPRGSMGVALGLWGVATGVPIVGIALGAVLELTRLAPPSAAVASRLPLVIRAVALAALAAFAYFAFTSPFPKALYAWLQWLPAILLPLPLAQSLAGGSISGAALSKALRPGSPPDPMEESVDASLAFLGVTLVGAAAGAAASLWFYAAAGTIVTWTLIAKVPRKALLPGVTLALAGMAIGVAVHVGLSALQGNVEEWSTALLEDYFAPKPDVFKERTRIGDLGRVKLNDRILMRVVPAGARPPQLLLREAAFDRYSNGEWQTARRVFKAVARDGERWRLREGTGGNMVSVRRSLSGGEGLLPLPAGSRWVDRLPAAALESLPTGAVRAQGAPHFVSMDVTYDESLELEPPSMALDLAVPDLIAPLLDRVLASGQLVKATPGQTLAAIEGFFGDKFSYSLDLSGSTRGAARTLGDFLERDHRGHCEYFGTATTLLLRRAGIPARYTVGYSAQEYSTLEHAFLVRSRHAHAWTSAYLGGRWVAVDTTPARWAEAEGEEARSLFGPMLDVASWLIESMVNLGLGRSATELAAAALMIVGFLVLVPLAVVLLRRGWRRPRAAPGSANAVTRAWQALEKRLARAGFRRARQETPLAWAQRLRGENPIEPWRDELVRLARAYYGAQFDPSASAQARDAFIRDARAWR
jgi:protein-glutamine gamma-glutamyltransferase